MQLDLRMWRVQMRWACRPDRYAHIIIHCMPLNVGEIIWSGFSGSGARINCNGLLVGILGYYEGGLVNMLLKMCIELNSMWPSGIRWIMPFCYLDVSMEVALRPACYNSGDWFWFCWIVILNLCCVLAKRAT